MMYCNSCGKQIPDTAKVCPYCGTMVTANLGTGADENPIGQRSSEEINVANRIFVDPSEQQIATLGGGYLRNYLSTGVLAKGFCVVSDKRVYFKGKCYFRERGKYKKKVDERIVGLRDVTGTGYTEMRHWWLKMIAIINIILAVITFMGSLFTAMFFYGDGAGMLFSIFCVIIAVVIMVAYLLLKKRLFEISYPGGSIAFSASSYGTAELQAFQRDIQRAREAYLSTRY